MKHQLNHKISRRTFLHTSSTVGALTALGQVVPTYAQTEHQGHRGTPATRRAPTVREFDLTIAKTTIDLDSIPAHAITVDGSTPRPLLRFREGDETVIRVHNRLRETTSIHWHGLILPEAMDGVPPSGNWTGLFQPGERGRLRFINAVGATFFDVRFPGLPMTVVHADGNDVQPVDVLLDLHGRSADQPQLAPMARGHDRVALSGRYPFAQIRTPTSAVLGQSLPRRPSADQPRRSRHGPRRGRLDHRFAVSDLLSVAPH